MDEARQKYYAGSPTIISHPRLAQVGIVFPVP